MSEPEWSVTPPPAEVPSRKHTTTYEGLAVTVEDHAGSYATWSVTGHLYDIAIHGVGTDIGRRPKLTIGQAKTEALRAARHMLAAGITGDRRPAPADPVDTIVDAFRARKAGEGGDGDA